MPDLEVGGSRRGHWPADERVQELYGELLQPSSGMFGPRRSAGPASPRPTDREPNPGPFGIAKEPSAMAAAPWEMRRAHP
jgi:hypothetical protein